MPQRNRRGLPMPFKGFVDVPSFRDAELDTTLDALNVVPWDPVTGRRRISKRPGTNRVFSDPVSSAGNPVQRMRQITLSAGAYTGSLTLPGTNPGETDEDGNWGFDDPEYVEPVEFDAATDLSLDSVSANEVTLSFSEATGGVPPYSYTLQRSSSPFFFVESATPTTVVDDTVEDGTVYQYRIKVVDQVGNQAFSNVLEVETPESEGGTLILLDAVGGSTGGVVFTHTGASGGTPPYVYGLQVFDSDMGWSAGSPIDGIDEPFGRGWHEASQQGETDQYRLRAQDADFNVFFSNEVTATRPVDQLDAGTLSYNSLSATVQLTGTNGGVTPYTHTLQSYKSEDDTWEFVQTISEDTSVSVDSDTTYRVRTTDSSPVTQADITNKVESGSPPDPPPTSGGDVAIEDREYSITLQNVDLGGGISIPNIGTTLSLNSDPGEPPVWIGRVTVPLVDSNIDLFFHLTLGQFFAGLVGFGGRNLVFVADAEPGQYSNELTEFSQRVELNNGLLGYASGINGTAFVSYFEA